MNPAVELWIALSVVGLALSLLLVRESRLDLEALGPRGNGRRAAARARLWRESLRISVHLVYLVIGISVLNRPCTPTGCFSPVVLGLMWGNVVMVCNSLIDAHARRALKAFLQAHD